MYTITLLNAFYYRNVQEKELLKKKMDTYKLNIQTCEVSDQLLQRSVAGKIFYKIDKTSSS